VPKKSELKRVRASLERERLRLKDEALQVEQARRSLLREREDALTRLRILSERYGLPDWSDDRPLGAIIELLAAGLPPPQPPVVRLPERAQRSFVRQVMALPEPVNRLTLERSGSGVRAVCDCGWKSTWLSREAEALAAAEGHERRLHA
jgi:hypothetical protein